MVLFAPWPLRSIPLAISFLALLPLPDQGRQGAPRPAPKPGPPQPSIVAVVTDRDGTTTTVTDVKARYAFSTYRSGDEPIIEDLDSVVMQLVTREGAVTVRDELRLPFVELRRIRWVSLGGHDRLELERRDGTTLSIQQIVGAGRTRDANYALEEKAPDGVVTKVTTYYEYALATLKRDGDVAGAALMRDLKFSAIIGKATTSTGRTGDFGLGYTVVREVEFK